MLVERNATIDAMDKYGWMPLHRAANGGRLEAALALIGHGADKNARGVYGGTPLDEAIANGHVEVAKQLAALGCSRTSPAGEGIRSALPHPMADRSCEFDHQRSDRHQSSVFLLFSSEFCTAPAPAG